MEIKNPLYKNQGIHVISTIFTVDKGITKVLIIKRKNEPFKDSWALPGGALYNNELLLDGAKRELYEKTGLKNIKLQEYKTYDDINRSPLMRMLGISYIGVIDSEKVKLLFETQKTSDADWVEITSLPQLAYDHNQIIKDAVIKLRDLILTTDILKSLFPNGFTIPEIEHTYEIILDKKIDRRNFRRQLLNLEFIEDTKKEVNFIGKKKAKLYKFK